MSSDRCSGTIVSTIDGKTPHGIPCWDSNYLTPQSSLVAGYSWHWSSSSKRFIRNILVPILRLHCACRTPNVWILSSSLIMCTHWFLNTSAVMTHVRMSHMHVLPQCFRCYDSCAHVTHAHAASILPAWLICAHHTRFLNISAAAAKIAQRLIWFPLKWFFNFFFPSFRRFRAKSISCARHTCFLSRGLRIDCTSTTIVMPSLRVFLQFVSGSRTLSQGRPVDVLSRDLYQKDRLGRAPRICPWSKIHF